MSDKARAQAFLAKTAEHHLTLAKLHGEACEREGADTEFHKSAMEAHASHAEHCVECCKAVDDSLGKKGFGVFRGPTEPEPMPEGLTLVPRYGQRSIEPIFKLHDESV